MARLSGRTGAAAGCEPGRALAPGVARGIGDGGVGPRIPICGLGPALRPAREFAMNQSTLKASEVEALTFIYAPDDPFGSLRRLGPRAGTRGYAIGWLLLAGITWLRLAAFTAPESYGL